MQLTVARIAPCPPWRMLTWATALVATLAVGCSQADVDLSDFNLSCTAEADCPVDRTCGGDGLCVARVGGGQAGGGGGGGGEGEGEGEGVGVGEGEGEGVGVGEGEGPDDEPVDCGDGCEGMVAQCLADDDESREDWLDECELKCEFLVRADPEIFRCVLDKFANERECDPGAAIADCTDTCDPRHGNACDADTGDQVCEALNEDGLGICVEPGPCAGLLDCASECPEDAADRTRCRQRCLEYHHPVDEAGEIDVRVLRTGVVALACEADCGDDPDHPVCDSRHDDGDCGWARTVCRLGGHPEDFACRDIVSCMLNTCNDSAQGCRNLCGGGPVDGQELADTHPAGWSALDDCIHRKCDDGNGMAAERCFRQECKGFVASSTDEEEGGRAIGCGYPIDAWPPGPPPDCWAVYECFVGCDEEWQDDGNLNRCKDNCGDPRGRRRAEPLFACMKLFCPGLMRERSCATSHCDAQWLACDENRDLPTPCMDMYFCREACDHNAGGDECRGRCFGPSSTQRDEDLATELHVCMGDSGCADHRNMECAKERCLRHLTRCESFLGVLCTGPGTCGHHNPPLFCAQVEADRYCTRLCGTPEECPNGWACEEVQMADQDNRVDGCRMPMNGQEPN